MVKMYRLLFNIGTAFAIFYLFSENPLKRQNKQTKSRLQRTNVSFSLIRSPLGMPAMFSNRINTSSEEGMQIVQVENEITMKTSMAKIHVESTTNKDTYGSVTHSNNRNA